MTIINTAKGASWHHTAHLRTFKVRGDGPPGTPPKRWTRQTSTSSSTMLVRMPINIPQAYVAKLWAASSGVSSSPYTWGQFLENDPWSPAHQPRKPFIHSHAPPIISATVGFGFSQSQS